MIAFCFYLRHSISTFLESELYVYAAPSGDLSWQLDVSQEMLWIISFPKLLVSLLLVWIIHLTLCLLVVVIFRQAERWREASNCAEKNQRATEGDGVFLESKLRVKLKMKANVWMNSFGGIMGKITANAKVLMPALHHNSESKHS